MGADRSSRATLTGVLLHHHDPGTRSGNPTLDDRRALDAQRCFTTQTVKNVPRQNGNDVGGLDKRRARVGYPLHGSRKQKPKRERMGRPPQGLGAPKDLLGMETWKLFRQDR